MLKNFARTAKRAGITAAIGLTLAVATAGPAAAAGTWHHVRDYTTAAACTKDGHTAVRDGSADAYQCRGSRATELWLKY